jgi:hypothetical protein
MPKLLLKPRKNPPTPPKSKLARAMQDTAERQLRAYVSIEAGLKKLNVGDVPEYQLFIQNTGQTPAYTIRHINRFALVPFPPTEPLPEAVAFATSGWTSSLGVDQIRVTTGIGSSIRRFANRPRPQFFASEVYCLEPVRLDHGQVPGNQFFDGRCFIY